MKRLEKAKEWANAHKKELIFSCTIVGSIGLGVIYCKHNNRNCKVVRATEKELTEYEKCVKMVDEDIFTNIAPLIEEAIVSDGIKGFHHEQSYPIEFNSGDVMLRKVTISVEDMGQYLEDES